MKKQLLFYRDFMGFTGGHLKVWDYFVHTQHSSVYRPEIYFSEGSDKSKMNPWVNTIDQALPEWHPDKADALFVGGMDWNMLPANEYSNSRIPIVNIIQGVRHADPDDIRYPFLKNRAVRVCVGEPVTEALHDTGQVNGPLFTIPNGIDFGQLPVSVEEKDIAVLISALKQPELGRQLSEQLAATGHQVMLVTKKLPRNEYLSLLARTKVGIFLPLEVEGFYLPALEAMAMGVVVVCPDCIGNRAYCQPDVNCLSPEYNIMGFVTAVAAALSLTDEKRNKLVEAGYNTAQHHRLENERKMFLTILEQLEHIW